MSVDTNIHILIVEDNESIRKLLVTVLTNIGFKNVSNAQDGRIAWSLIQRENVDLVITDWMMPHMDGMELIKNIRKSDQNFKNIPILMITASDKQEDIVQMAKLNINGYIVKPFSVKTILLKIRECLT